ncbi:MAG: shikimate kinase [Verrucomicrobia bacterium]|nr:shikimate kinase [Verrucomicrobiota bacterium]
MEQPRCPPERSDLPRRSGRPGIVLIGFMGAGKSAVGRELARRTGLPRRDTDEMMRRRFGLSIPQIFSQRGEAAFRDAETEALRRLSANAIIVTGGGIVLREENVRLLHALGRTIWLDADEQTLWERAARRPTRPLLKTANPRERFAELFHQRRALYASAADGRIDTTARSLSEVAHEILCTFVSS